MRVLLNLVLILFEIAACAAVAWLGFTHPLIFAAVTGALAFVLGLRLEILRLRNEMPFYFGPRQCAARPVCPGRRIRRSVLQGARRRRRRAFHIFGDGPGTPVLGRGRLRPHDLRRCRAPALLAIKLDARPERWGFFRLGPPLGLLFSAALAFLALYGLVPSPTVSDIGWTIVWEMPKIPTVEQTSELFFRLKQAFDDFVVTLLSNYVPPSSARAIGIIVSVNVLAGFVASLYAAVIAGLVRRAEPR